MKTCTKCGFTGEEENFQKHSGRSSRYNQCKECRSLLSKAHFQKNREAYRERTRIARRKFDKKINELKSIPCMDCKILYPYYVMDFDHRDPSLKVIEISKLKGRSCSIPLLLKEVEKCDVVCSNCHRERTYKRRFYILV